MIANPQQIFNCVIPAKAGIHLTERIQLSFWMDPGFRRDDTFHHS
jgi:hypothetical protein